MSPEKQIVPNQLILFTRYPEPGTTKTRLIPALGADGAATLSRHMTEHTLAQVQMLQDQYWLQVEIRFAGGTSELMQGWLGTEWTYTVQGTGDLGDRLLRSLQAAFNSGRSRVIIIGTDCPELNASLLQQAFDTLTHHDLVLGPALDGGYYLIGVSRLIPELFHDIPWSTATVCQRTLEIGQQLGLAIAQLPPLSDIDYPEDLAIWQRVQQTMVNSSPAH